MSCAKPVRSASTKIRRIYSRTSTRWGAVGDAELSSYHGGLQAPEPLPCSAGELHLSILYFLVVNKGRVEMNGRSVVAGSIWTCLPLGLLAASIVWAEP